MAGDPKDDLYILTDLHLGGGLPQGRIRYTRLENFFYDAPFERFIRKLLDVQAKRGRRAALILGGDIFDFLTLTDTPSPEEARESGMQINRTIRRFGLNSSPRHAEWKLRYIASGHRRFFFAVGAFLAAGHRIVVVTGNHDVELYWARVRETLAELLLDYAEQVRPDLDPVEARTRIEFRQWFYREPGRVYFEHGNQYEATNSIRYNLCPVQPSEDGGEQRELDLPIGSIFVRYLYNETRRRNPYLANFVSMEQYMSALGRLNLADILGVLLRRLPFFSRALRAARLFETSTWSKIRQEHNRRLEAEAKREQLPVSSLIAIQEMKSMPDGLTKYHVALSMLKPVLVKIIKYVVFAAAAVFCWFLVFSLIQSTPWLAEGVLGKASLTAILAVLTVLAVFVFMNRLTTRIRQVQINSIPDIFFKARRIAELTSVRHVVMGHTHVADLRPLGKRFGFFANTGTWISMTGTWDHLWPKSRRFTFIRLKEDELELLRWDDEADRFEEVFLLEDYQLRPADVLFPEDPIGTLTDAPKTPARMDSMDRLDRV